MDKHFIINPNKVSISREVLETSRIEEEFVASIREKEKVKIAKSKITEEDNLIHVEGRIVVKVDVNYKNSHKFSDGTVIRLERAYNNFNRRETQPINCIVISAANIPKNAELLVDHNAFVETNRINDYKNSFENDESDLVRYFSVPNEECYAYRIGQGEWMPMDGFDFALMIFKPYEGMLQGIEPTLVKDMLFVTTGELKGHVVKTLKGCNYIIVFQGDDGREKRILRFRPFGNEKLHLEEEAICIMHELTDKVNKGELLLGLDKNRCEPLERGESISGY